MVRPRWRKVLRDIWLHKARTLLVVTAIAIGLVGAGAVLDTWALLRVVVDVGYRATNPAAATLRTDSIDAALLAHVRTLPGVRDAQARRVVGAQALVQGGWTPVMLFVMDDFAALRIGLVEPVAGAWPATDGAIVIERSSLQVAGRGVGDSVIVRVAGGPSRPLAVTGVARDAGLAPGWMEHVIYAFVTPATLAGLGAPNTMDQLQIVVADGTLDQDGVRGVAYAVKADLEARRRTVTDITVPVPGRHVHADQMNSLLATQVAFGLLALVLSGFLVVNLIAAMLAGQVREIGVMKAIGARSGQIAAMYLVLALVLGLVASLIAIPIAAQLGGQYAEFSASMLNFDTTGHAVPRWMLALQLAVGALLPVAAASMPVARGCRISVGEALRDFGISATTTGGGWSARLGGVRRPMLLSLRNAFRKRQRTVLTLSALALGGAVFLGALNLRASIIGAMDTMFRAMRFSSSVQFAEPYAVERIESAARRTEGVAIAEAWGGGGAAVARADGTFGNGFGVSALPPGTRLLNTTVQRGRWLRAGDSNALVISGRLPGEEPAMQLGATVTLVIRGKPSQWTVVGVVSSFVPQAWAPRAAWAAAVGDARVRRVVVATTATGTMAQAEVQRRLTQDLVRDMLDVSGGTLVADNRAAIEDHLLMVVNFLAMMSWLMIAVGGLGLASTMSLAVLERTREIGVMRALGARHGTIHAIVQVEGLVIAALSWLVAIPLSLPMTVVLANAFGRIFFKAPVTFVPVVQGMLVWLGLVLAVSVVACAWPAFRATRVTTAAALAYE